MGILNIKEYQRMSDEYAKVKYPCKCGRKVVIPAWVERQLCDWCGIWVYKDKKTEFKYKLKEKVKKGV